MDQYYEAVTNLFGDEISVGWTECISESSDCEVRKDCHYDDDKHQEPLTRITP